MCYIFYKTSYESSIQKAELWDYHLRIAMSNARFRVSLRETKKHDLKIGKMAIYHLSVKSGKNQSSTGTRGASHYAYINRDGKYKREDIEFSQSGNLPTWAKDAKHFWKSADQYERANGRVYTELEISLPRELNQEQRQALIEKFVAHTLGENFTYSYAIHNPLSSDGEQNPHVHLMFSERKLDGIDRNEEQHFKRYNAKNPELGGAGKDRYFSARKFVSDVRMSWADIANDYMQSLGLDARIDHRSYQKIGTEIQSQNFRADYISHDKYLINENIQAIKKQNGDTIIERPSEALKVLTSTQSVFTMNELERFLSAHTDGEAQFLKAKEAVLTSPDLEMLFGKDWVVFSSKELVSIEDSISTFVYNANQNSRIQKPVTLIDKLPLNAVRTAETRTFNPEQEKAFYTLTSTDRISLLSGSAGTGKSYVLSAVSEAYKDSDYQVYGIALQAITAKAIAKDCDIESRTIASFLAKYESGNLEINNKTVLILDEAGMVGSRDMQKLLMLVEKHDAQIKLVGDSYQLNAVLAGSTFKFIQDNLDHKNIASLEDIQRQKHAVESEKMLEASKLLSKHKVGDALEIYKSIDAIREYETHDQALAKTVKSWSEDPSDNKLMLAHKNSDVNALNAMARSILIDEGKLDAQSHSIQCYRGAIEIAVGEKIVFKQNNSAMNVSNGEVAQVIGFELDESKKPKAMMVQSQNDHSIIKVDLSEYNHFRYGYANTIHSSQGMTVDSAYIVASETMNANLTYVALTRHKHNVEVNYSAENFQADKPNQSAFEQLKTSLSQSENKLYTTDYTVVEAKDKLIQSYLQDHRSHIEQKRQFYGINEKLYALTSDQQTFTKDAIVSEVRASLKSKSLLGDEIVKLNGKMNIAKGEELKLLNDVEVKTGFFKKESFSKGTEIKVIDAYKVKDQPMIKARIYNKEYEIPLSKMKLDYSDKYFNEYKQNTKARFDARYKTEVHSKFREEIAMQKNTAPSVNINSPINQLKQQQAPKQNAPRHTPRY